MFGQVDKIKTEHRQLVDSMHNEEVIEAKIKECQRENDRCMISTSNRLRKQFGDEAVDRTLQRLFQRRYRGNKYQEKGVNQAMNLPEQLTNKKVNQETFSL
tara:strand:- start:308 stop:610 length:303 start_codon:yes stop_codon:yes gene_type:complete